MRAAARRLAPGLLPALLLALTLAACARHDEGPAVQADRARDLATQAIAGQHLRRQIDDTARTLDPSLCTDIIGQRVIDDLFEGLVRLDPAGRIAPGVARSWETSADGLKWTFHLRDDARWSNGERVTAADFVYGWRREVDPNTASETAQQMAPIVNALAIAAGKMPLSSLGVQARDALTLDVQLTAPTGYFLYLLTNQYLFPQHQATIDAYGPSWTDAGKLVGNGAFTLADQRINGPIHLRRNPHYWDAAAVRLNEVTYFPVTERDSAVSRYLAGDVDLTDGFPIDDIGWLRQRVGTELYLAPYFGTVMLGINVSRPPFNSVPLRQAMNLAIDRDVIAEKLRRGVYLPAYNVVPPLEGYPRVQPEWATWPTAKRHELARKLYAEAGYTKDNPLHVDFSFPTPDADTRLVFEALAAMWRVNLGAEVALVNEEWRVHQQNRKLGKPDLFWIAWIADYLDPLTFLALAQKGNTQNYGRYDNALYEKALASAVTRVDPALRYQDYVAAEKVLNEDPAFFPLYFYQSRHLVRSYVKGFQPNIVDRNLSRDLYLTAGGS
ncbi:MAG: peptide ABC transporter substrate-binding protein [Pseudomonadota bacterium]